MLVFFALSTVASADMVAGGSNAKSGKQHPGGAAFGGTMSSEARLGLLKEKLAELDGKKNELMRKIGELRGGASSTSSGSGDNDMKKRFCGPGLLGNVGSSTSHVRGDIKKRLCERWDNASSTPSKPRATSTPLVKVLSPNGEKAYKNRNGAVVIRWKNTTADTTVDIDLEKSGSTTISIAKDVKGLPIKQMKGGQGKNAAFLGGAMGIMRCSSHESKSWDKACGPAFSYRWKDASLGEGYKIVVTTKVGDTTYSDKSDNEFSIVAAPNNFRENNRLKSDAAEDGHDDEHDEHGDVLGAQTSIEDEITNSFNELEDTLAMLSVELSSQ